MSEAFYWLAVPTLMVGAMVLAGLIVEHLGPRAKRAWLKRLRRIERGRAAQAKGTTDYTDQLAAQARWIEQNCYWHRGD